MWCRHDRGAAGTVLGELQADAAHWQWQAAFWVYAALRAATLLRTLPGLLLLAQKAADVCSTALHGTHPPPPPPPARLDAARARPPVSAAKGHLADAEAARVSIRRRAIGRIAT